MGNVAQVVESTVNGLGYVLVDHEFGRPGRMLRVFIDLPDMPQEAARASDASSDSRASARTGVTLDDCERVTRQLQRVLEVEGIDYARLEVSSPGLDRVLKKPADFRRFAGATAAVRLREPLNGRRKFVGVLRGAREDTIDLEVDGALVSLPYLNVDKARLVPKL